MNCIAERIVNLLNGNIPKNNNWLAWLIKSELDQLPMPGSGSTLERWRALAAVAQFDLSLTKLYEGHTDALAILNELEGHRPSAGIWGVWAAEAPGGKTVIRSREGNKVILTGTKFWCSGAALADCALLTAWDEDGTGPHLIAVELKQQGIAINTESWKAIGMAGSMNANVTFTDVPARQVGSVGAYLSRPGFWQGGAGIAACWYGGALRIATVLRESLLESPSYDPSGYKQAALGKIELVLNETASVLREAARWIDQYPTTDASRAALLARLSAERCAKQVIDQVGKAMGATPFCQDEKFAKTAADLPVFIRQNHAYRDFLALGEHSLKQEASAWML